MLASTFPGRPHPIGGRFPLRRTCNATTTYCSLKRIKLGRNPRTYFDPKAMAELTESIRAHGVDTPIIVRPVTEDEFDYEVIAGGRRYRGAMDAHGEDFPMPIVVKDVDEVEARCIALTENIQRDNLSPSEEAVDAAELLGLHGGERDVTAKILGWSRSTLDSRLALLNCSKAVLDALSERKINIAHAELLAALSKENQDKVLPVVVAEKRSVADVKRLSSSKAAASICITSLAFRRNQQLFNASGTSA
jgi:ParB family transcriptional regulator, chromosome partitioning protein